MFVLEQISSLGIVRQLLFLSVCFVSSHCLTSSSFFPLGFQPDLLAMNQETEHSKHRKCVKCVLDLQPGLSVTEQPTQCCCFVKIISWTCQMEACRTCGSCIHLSGKGILFIRSAWWAQEFYKHFFKCKKTTASYKRAADSLDLFFIWI